MTRIALIACSAKKLPHAAPARQLYQGDLFRRAVAYAEATCAAWYVLSALHGVVDPDEVLEPYELSLQDVVRSGRGKLLHPDPHTAWASRCRGALMGDVEWIRDSVQQCQSAGVPVFVKQLGARPYQSPRHEGDTGYELRLRDKAGGDPAEWPEDLRVRELPVWPAAARAERSACLDDGKAVTEG